MLRLFVTAHLLQALRRCSQVLITVLAISVLPALSHASEEPHQRVERITASLMQLIEEYREDYESRSDEYFADLSELLDTHVDFRFIARGVMGPFYQRASEPQIERFITVFRNGLVETYGRGLGSYTNQRIELLPYEPVSPGQRSVTVRQQITSEGTIYPLQYSMGKSRSTGEWQIINVIINGINLGKTFRTQFVQAANRNGGDIDAVIDGWTTTAEE
ncbi:MAG: MlaC/ttg2D family ABC transporter substrate-binding protein [Porticoccaceae bacterium]